MMTENDIVKTLTAESEKFRKLGEEHRLLDEKLARMSDRVYLSADEQLEKKKVKKLKLLKKDQMAEMIRKYKESHSLN